MLAFRNLGVAAAKDDSEDKYNPIAARERMGVVLRSRKRESIIADRRSKLKSRSRRNSHSVVSDGEGPEEPLTIGAIPEQLVDAIIEEPANKEQEEGEWESSGHDQTPQ